MKLVVFVMEANDESLTIMSLNIRFGCELDIGFVEDLPCCQSIVANEYGLHWIAMCSTGHVA